MAVFAMWLEEEIIAIAWGFQANVIGGYPLKKWFEEFVPATVGKMISEEYRLSMSEA